MSNLKMDYYAVYGKLVEQIDRDNAAEHREMFGLGKTKYSEDIRKGLWDHFSDVPWFTHIRLKTVKARFEATCSPCAYCGVSPCVHSVRSDREDTCMTAAEPFYLAAEVASGMRTDIEKAALADNRKAIASAISLVKLDDSRLEDLFSDAMSDVHDMGTTHRDFARACIRSLRKELKV